MKKMISLGAMVLLFFVMACHVFAFEPLMLECENGVVSGSPVKFNYNAVQEKSNASNGLVVGLSGSNDDPTLGTEVVFSEIELPENGTYKITLHYDTNNDAKKEADLLIDGVRYAVDIHMDELPADWNTEYQDYSMEIELSKGTHAIGVASSQNLNRNKDNPDTYVKSINADYLLIELVAVTPDAAEPSAPKTMDTGMTALLLCAASVWTAAKLKKNR